MALNEAIKFVGISEMNPTVSMKYELIWLGRAVVWADTSKVANNSSFGSSFSVPKNEK